MNRQLLLCVGIAVAAAAATWGQSYTVDCVSTTLTLENIRIPVSGLILTEDDANLVFAHKTGNIIVPYRNITGIQFGQGQVRRASQPALIQKRENYLTLGFKDALGEPQAIAFRLPKDSAKGIVTLIEVRANLKAVFDSAEARKRFYY